MKKLVLSLVVFALSFFTFFVSSVSAKVISNESSVTISKGETVNDDLFIGSQSVVIDGIVNGDVFVGAQSVRVGGNINGSLHVGANSVEITGKVTGNVYAGGQNISVQGATIGGSLLMGGATVGVGDGTVVGGSLLSGAGVVSIDSQIRRNLMLASSSMSIGENTRVGKDFDYVANKDEGVAISDKAVVSGETHKSEVKANKADVSKIKGDVMAVFNGLKTATEVISFLGALIVWYLANKFVGKFMEGSSMMITKSFFKSLGLGLLVCVLMIPAFLILVITGVGVPLAGVLALVLMLFVYLAKIVVAVSLGGWLVKLLKLKQPSSFITFGLGLLVIYILKFVHPLSFLSSVVVLWSGLGGLTKQLYEGRSR